MEEKRKNAYRYLLYRAMIEIREIDDIFLSCKINRYKWLPPLYWRKLTKHARNAGMITEWFHNFAYYSSMDFVGFKEDMFWNVGDFLALFTIAYLPRTHIDTLRGWRARLLPSRGCA